MKIWSVCHSELITFLGTLSYYIFPVLLIYFRNCGLTYFTTMGTLWNHVNLLCSFILPVYLLYWDWLCSKEVEVEEEECVILNDKDDIEVTNQAKRRDFGRWVLHLDEL